MCTAANKKPRFTDYSRLRPDAMGRILFDPFAEIPARERWLYKNPKALKMVRQGLKESAERKGRFRGSFAKYANDDMDDESRTRSG